MSSECQCRSCVICKRVQEQKDMLAAMLRKIEEAKTPQWKWGSQEDSIHFDIIDGQVEIIACVSGVYKTFTLPKNDLLSFCQRIVSNPS